MEECTMAKTIKFNLVCNNQPIRTIEDLQNNFSVEDVLTYYQNSLLQRWLKVRGYADELEKVLTITSEKPIDIIKELISIFQIVSDEEEVKKSIVTLEYLLDRKELYAIYDQQHKKVQDIIDDYRVGYEQLVNKILEYPEDITIIKATLKEMIENYEWVLKLNNRELFYQLKEQSILAVMCLLMNEKTRKYYLPQKKSISSSEESNYELASDMDLDKARMFQEICGMIRKADFKEKLGKACRIFSGVTDGYWKDLEPKEKKYMIIIMERGDFVRSAGKAGGDLAYEDIINKFQIINGIDYKSNSSVHELVYMEV